MGAQAVGVMPRDARESRRRRQSKAKDCTPEQHANFVAEVIEAITLLADRAQAKRSRARQSSLTTQTTNPRARHLRQPDGITCLAAPLAHMIGMTWGFSVAGGLGLLLYLVAAALFGRLPRP
ncbi:MAG: hypothetical protein ACYSUQ_04285 [Planctomycetota bacterium]